MLGAGLQRMGQLAVHADPEGASYTFALVTLLVQTWICHMDMHAMRIGTVAIAR